MQQQGETLKRWMSLKCDATTWIKWQKIKIQEDDEEEETLKKFCCQKIKKKKSLTILQCNQFRDQVCTSLKCLFLIHATSAAAAYNHPYVTLYALQCKVYTYILVF